MAVKIMRRVSFYLTDGTAFPIICEPEDIFRHGKELGLWKGERGGFAFQRTFFLRDFSSVGIQTYPGEEPKEVASKDPSIIEPEPFPFR